MRRFFFPLAISVSLTSLFSVGARSADAGDPYLNVLGNPAPEWEVRDWINSKPLTLKGFRGRVVLIRWWTGPDCPYCSASAPVLSELHHRYKDKGLVVIGFYHHKEAGPVNPEDVARLGKKMGLDFPLAIDPDWKTLKRYWLERASNAEWTSVSFLINQEGVVRYIHPGGTISHGDGEELKRQIEELLHKGGRKQ